MCQNHVFTFPFPFVPHFSKLQLCMLRLDNLGAAPGTRNCPAFFCQRNSLFGFLLFFWSTVWGVYSSFSFYSNTKMRLLTKWNFLYVAVLNFPCVLIDELLIIQSFFVSFIVYYFSLSTSISIFSVFIHSFFILLRFFIRFLSSFLGLLFLS